MNCNIHIELYRMACSDSSINTSVNTDWTLSARDILELLTYRPWFLLGIIFLLGKAAGVWKVHAFLIRLLRELAYCNTLHKFLDNLCVLCKYTWRLASTVLYMICDALSDVCTGYIQSILGNLGTKLLELLGFITHCLWNITSVINETYGRLGLIYYLQWNCRRLRFISHQVHRMFDSWLGFTCLLLLLSHKV